jgi:frataxin-like iron-binding protein CyaY
VISTEGGAIVGAAEDPRYPPVREEDLTTLTLGAYHTMLDEAPPYFFAHTAWLMANSAGEHFDERFEQAAWYKDRKGAILPVVEALKADPRKNEVRNWQEPELPSSK